MNIYDLCIKYTKAGDFIVNIGVHRGQELFGILSHLNYTHGYAWGFEANPELAKQLIEKVSREDIKNLTIIPEGVHEKPGILDFYNSPANDQLSNSFESDLVEHHNQAFPHIFKDPRMDIIKIPVTSLDVFFPMQKIDFILCDAQGADGFVIKGGQKLITTHLPTMIYEWEGSIKDEDTTWYYNFLKNLGYFIYRIEQFTEIEKPENMFTHGRGYNILCSRERL